ncbi:MAG: hypothetical protein K6B67_00295 [Lachnospiraceae bacterium]|nr:hypothetical protein [Lachnospiraceae bacterium]
MFKLKTISKKVVALLGAAALAVTLFAGSLMTDAGVVNAAGAVTATITYTAQFDGAFKDVKVSVPVSSDTAENYGYTDSVAVDQGVSMLDVLVQIHKDIFPEYTAANKDEYLGIGDDGWVTNAFAKGGSSISYYKNGESVSGLSVTAEDGDVVDAFYYQDITRYSDFYALFDNVTFSDRYIEGTALKDKWGAKSPLANAELGWLNLDTLELTPAGSWQPVKTDENGRFSVQMPNTSANYMLTVLDGTTGSTPLVRTLCVSYPTKPVVTTAAKSLTQEREIYAAAGKYLANTNKSISYGNAKEGYLLGLGRAGFPVADGLYSGYYDSVKNYLAANGNKFSEVTECAKVVGALNAIGYDPTNVGGVDITTQLSDSANVNGTYGYAYALLALDSKNYASGARDGYVAALVNSQNPDGGWGWSASSDIDTTGMVLAALAPYKSNAAASAAINKAVNFLSNVQAADGAFSSGMDENSNTTAMVVFGLSENGINADTDSRFIKNGVSAVDALCSYAVAGSGFGWTDNTSVNDYATYQSYYALGSYFRNETGMNRLFDMTSESIIASTNSNVVLADPNGVLPASTFIESEQITSGATFDNANNLINSEYSDVTNTAVFEIDLFDSSLAEIHELNGVVYVGVTLPFTVSAGNKLVAYRVDGDKLIKCDVECEPGTNRALLATNHFSTFIFAEVPEDAISATEALNASVAVVAPKTGDDFVLWISLILLGLGCGVVMYSKKKRG